MVANESYQQNLVQNDDKNSDEEVKLLEPASVSQNLQEQGSETLLEQAFKRQKVNPIGFKEFESILKELDIDALKTWENWENR